MAYDYYYNRERTYGCRRKRRPMREIIFLVRMGVLIVLLISLLALGGMFAAQVDQDKGGVDRSVDKNSMNTFGGSSYTYTISDSFSD